MKILMTTVAVAAMAFVPATAQAQLFGGFDNGTLLGGAAGAGLGGCLLYTSPSPRDRTRSRMPSSA